MPIDTDRFHKWINSAESEHVELKEAKTQIDSTSLINYCVALANEGGGYLVLGVTNKKPRKVVGSNAYRNVNEAKALLLRSIHFRVDVEEFFHEGKRAVVFTVPSRPIGMPIQYKGAYWMRSGESLVPMTADQLKRIFDEVQPDFSAAICPATTLDDLDPVAIERLRQMWHRKSRNDALLESTDLQLLSDAELIIDGEVTHAALILLGRQTSLSRYLSQAEIVFEYRSNDTSIEYQQRKEFRKGFLLYDDDLWALINLRNDIQHFQEGLFVRDIPTFNEGAIREALLNAVSHRDYRLGGSVFVRQYPRKIEIISPGGFPAGITVDNILYRQAPRNRRISEVLSKLGLMERSGQGVDKMFRLSISESKQPPDFSGTDNHQVKLTLHGEVKDLNFLRFLERIGQETHSTFSTEDLLILDYIREGKQISQNLRGRLVRLIDLGVIESLGGRGRGARYILAKRYYTFIGKKGIYTRKKGLDRETNKELIIKHLRHHKTGVITDFEEMLPALSRRQIHGLLKSLRKEGKVRLEGARRGSYWELT